MPKVKDVKINNALNKQLIIIITKIIVFVNGYGLTFIRDNNLKGGSLNEIQ